MLQNLLIVIIVFSISTKYSYSQSAFKQFVKQNIVSIKSISPQENDYSDLDAIGNAIGNSQIVLLGEQDHGDAPTFLAKTRLIKYLHEKKGFNVLAFESDFFALNFGWDRTTKIKGRTDSLIRYSIYNIWINCKACSNLLYEYVPATFATATPLQLSGFDCQMSSFYSAKHLGKTLDSMLRRLEPPIIKSQNYETEIVPILDSISIGGSRDTAVYQQRILLLTTIMHQLQSKLEANDFLMRFVENLIKVNLEYKTGQSDRQFSMKVRDETMAENIKWLSEVKYRNEKIIVWAANFHIAKDAGTFNFGVGAGKKLISMGSVLAKDSSLKNKMYVLGFTSYEGEAGRLGSIVAYKVNKPGPSFFESWIRKDFQYAFINFKDYKKEDGKGSEAYYARPFGHGLKQKEEWHKIFDGMFFIRHMYSCVE